MSFLNLLVVSYKKSNSSNFSVSDPQKHPGPDDYKDLDVQNDRHLRVVDGALIIKNIQKSHEGFYLCQASNGIGGISAVARLAVQGNLNILCTCHINWLMYYYPLMYA